MYAKILHDIRQAFQSKIKDICILLFLNYTEYNFNRQLYELLYLTTLWFYEYNNAILFENILISLKLNIGEIHESLKCCVLDKNGSRHCDAAGTTHIGVLG